LKINELSPRQQAIHGRLSTDLEYFCRTSLKVETKAGNIAPFIWNRAQWHIHEQLEKQLAETGMVRALILKGRQQGCSTIVTARYYHKTTWQDHKKAYILSHEAQSTQTLLEKVNLYYDECPEVIRPKKEVGNKNELKFDNHSSYKVGTAGAKNTGRSQTNQYFHGSEVAFYDNTEGISTGVLQTVADVPGTEIILESTANGMGNFFHRACMDALSGLGKYILIFVPWYWQEEYRAKVPLGWEFSQQELEIKELYELDNEQLYWRYLKILELKSEWMFKQEYPFTVAEAFQSSGKTFYEPTDIHRARKTHLTDLNAPLILGVDPARKGDRTILTLRRGREIVEVIKYDEMETMRLAGIVAGLIDKRGIAKVFIDFGLGYGTVDRLHELGYAKIVQGVHFGERPIDPQYLNKRAEMAFEFRDWLQEGGCSIPDDEEIEADLLAIPDFRQNSRNLLYLEPKDKIKEMFGKSPDIFDSIILTFAYPVHNAIQQNNTIGRTENTKRGSQLQTLSRVRSQGKVNDTTDWGPEPPDTLQNSSRAWRKR
jgi:hypothetical protein